MIITKYLTRYGVTFTVGSNSYHSYKDFGVFPEEWPEIPPGKVKTHSVALPGADGSLDMTESLTGFPTYETRKGTFTFLCPDRGRWDGVLTAMAAALHGRTAVIVKDEEPDFEYRGRVSVDRLACDRVRGIVTVTAELEPFKYAPVWTGAQAYSQILGRTISAWLWDPFSFVTGVIRDYTAIEVDGTRTVTVVSSPAGGAASVYASAAGMTVTVGEGEARSLAANDWTSLTEDLLPRGVEEVPFTFTGTGTVRINYRPGYL